MPNSQNTDYKAITSISTSINVRKRTFAVRVRTSVIVTKNHRQKRFPGNDLCFKILLFYICRTKYTNIEYAIIKVRRATHGIYMAT